MSVIEDVRFLSVAGFYVACNFMPLWMLFAGYLIVTGQFWGYVLLIVFAAEGVARARRMRGSEATEPAI